MDMQTTIDIQADPAEIWRVMSDVEHWADWTPTIKSVQLLNGRELAPGVKARIRQPRLPVAVWTVDEVIPGRSFTWSATGLGTKTTATHSIDPIAGGYRVTLGIRQNGLLFKLAPWLKSMTQRYIDTEAKELKKRSESKVLV